jgi:hypothetical protein
MSLMRVQRMCSVQSAGAAKNLSADEVHFLPIFE